MEQRAVDNLYQQIRRKEEEYNELESAYRMQKKVFEAKHEEIFDRKFQLARIADDEAGKLMHFYIRPIILIMMENVFFKVCSN